MGRVGIPLVLILYLLMAPAAQAAVPSLSNLNIQQTDAAFRTFAAATAFRAVEPASAYGRIWGISFGVIGALASTSEFTAVVPVSKDPKVIPGGGVYVGAQAPLGLGVELGVLPKLEVGGAKVSTIGGNLKWTVNRVFLEHSPVDLALRAMYTKAQINHRQTSSGAVADVEFKTQMIGTNVSVSVPLLIFEPYVGYGMIRQGGTLSSTGSVVLFNQNFTDSSSVKGENTSGWFHAGLQIRLLILTIGAEYDRIFGVNTYAAKVGFKI